MGDELIKTGYHKVINTDTTAVAKQRVLQQLKDIGIKFPKTEKKQNNELPKDPVKAIKEQVEKLKKEGYTDEEIKQLQQILDRMRKNY